MREDEFFTFQRRLPQWRLRGGVYFVTWRISPNYASLTLADRDLVASAIKHFNGDRYQPLAFVVMDDHVHVVVKPAERYPLSKILHSWKSYTAHELNKLRGRQGAVWQEDNYTRIIRNEQELQDSAGYILNNPRKRWPDVKEYPFIEFFSP